MVEEMKLPERYKNSKIGVIPEDWEVVSIGEILEFKNGLNKEKKYFGKGTPIVNYMDVYRNRGLKKGDIEGKVTVSKSELLAYNVKKGDVFFTRTSETAEEIGISSVLLESIDDTVFSGFILRGRPISEILVDEYKKYCFSANFVRKEIQSNCTYTTRALTNGKVLSKVNILVPNNDEQKAIAEALSDIDSLIKSIEKLIDKKKRIKQGTMQKFLTGKNRFPGFSGEWTIKKLGEIATMYSGGTPLSSNPRFYGGEIPWITSGDLNQGRINEVKGRITQSGFENSSAKMINKGTLLVALYGATAGVAAISDIDAAINQAVLAIIPDRKNDSTFLFYKLTYLKEWIIKTYTQGGQPNLSGHIMKSIEIELPKLEEQLAISQMILDMDLEIDAIGNKLEKYKEIKEGMMQELLTGRKRLV